jgi:hypothetical protein
VVEVTQHERVTVQVMQPRDRRAGLLGQHLSIDEFVGAGRDLQLCRQFSMNAPLVEPRHEDLERLHGPPGAGASSGILGPLRRNE